VWLKLFAGVTASVCVNVPPGTDTISDESTADGSIVIVAVPVGVVGECFLLQLNNIKNNIKTDIEIITFFMHASMYRIQVINWSKFKLIFDKSKHFLLFIRYQVKT
jgi:hypothetical protein